MTDKVKNLTWYNSLKSLSHQTMNMHGYRVKNVFWNTLLDLSTTHF